jgi:hypothetical protein
MHKRTARKLAERFLPTAIDLDNPTDPYIEALTHWKLLRTRPRLEPRSGLEDWARLSLTRQAQRWLAQWEMGSHYVPSGYSYYGPEPKEFHGKLLGLLRECPVEEWVSFRSFAARLRGLHPFWLRSREEIVRYGGFSALQKLEEAWSENEERLLRIMLGVFLADLGIVRVSSAPTREIGDLRALSVTAFGAQVLGGPKEQTKDEARSLLVQPNFELLVMQPCGPLWYGLARFAEPISCDRIATFKLTPTSVRGGVSQGLTAEAMQRFLGDHSSRPVPQNVAYELEEWAGQVRHARVRAALVVETDGPEAIPALLASVASRGRGMAAGDAVVLPPETDVNRLLVALETAGFTATIAEWDSDIPE